MATGSIHEPATEIEEVTAAIFEQFHLFEEGTNDLAVFVSDRVLSASGRKGPTLFVAPNALDAFRAKRGLDGAAFISIGPSDRGPLNAVGYDIVVRRTERGWVVRSLRQAWVS